MIVTVPISAAARIYVHSVGFWAKKADKQQRKMKAAISHNF